MTGQVDPERRLRCLTLGTYAQAVVERLVQAPEQREDDLAELVTDTLTAVAAIRARGWPKDSASGLRPFRYFDQVQVLYEVLGVERDEQDIAPILSALKENPKSPDKKIIEPALRFFRELAEAALNLISLLTMQSAGFGLDAQWARRPPSAERFQTSTTYSRT